MTDETAGADSYARNLLRARRIEEEVTTRLRKSIYEMRQKRVFGPPPLVAEDGTLINPEEYVDPKHFAEDYLMASICKKCTTFVDRESTERAARLKFFEAETHNRLTNLRLASLTGHPEWVNAASHNLVQILGPLTTDVLNKVAEGGTFGPGTNVGVTGDCVVKSLKYDSRPTMTEGLLPFFPAIAGPLVMDYWHPGSKGPRIVGGNSHFTVLKNAETDRNACKEPIWNSKIQAGVGAHMGTRLKLFGVDIRDQSINQKLASRAQRDGNATIDLKQASDMVAHMCVWLLLVINGSLQGSRWWYLLNMIRSKAVSIKDPNDADRKIEHVLEMISTMGNGFTFPLESAIFLAVVRSAVPFTLWGQCAVYGDDIICPQTHAREVIDRLEYLGFQVNTQKTCLAGKFFESCGTDWFDSQNVRPFYLVWDSESPVPYTVSIANALRLWLHRVYGYCPQEFRPLWNWLKGQTSVKAFRCPVPKSMGDLGLLSSAEESGILLKANDGFLEGLVVRHALVSTVDVDRRSFGVLASALDAARSTYTDLMPLDPLRGTELRSVKWLARSLAASGVAERNCGTKGLETLRNQFGDVRTGTTLVPSWHEEDLNWY